MYRTYPKILIPFIFISASIASIAVIAESSTDLELLITFPEEEYSMGSSATIDLHVFLEGEYIDADRIECWIGTSLKEVSVFRKSTGLYKASFVIEEEEMDEFNLNIKSRVWKGDDVAYNQKSLYISDYPELEVRVFIDDPSDITPVPGQEVEFTVTTSSLGKYIDPDNDTVSAHVSTGLFPDIGLDLIHQSVGTFRGVFKIPNDWALFRTCWIYAHAALRTGRFYSEDTGGTSIAIRIFDVWYRCDYINSTNASIEFNVLDLTGGPIPGAMLSLTSYYSRLDGGNTETWHNLTTNSDGQVRMELTFNNASSRESEVPSICFSGTISYQGLIQYILGGIPIPGTVIMEEEGTSRFKMVLLSDSNIQKGVQANLSYVAKFDDEPLAFQRISGYIYGDHNLYWYGNVKTDKNGSFTIEFIPSATTDGINGEEQLSVRFITRVNEALFDIWKDTALIVRSHNNTWESMAELSPMTFIQVTDEPGKREYQLCLFTEGGDGIDESACILWGVGTADEHQIKNTEIFKYMNIGALEFGNGALLPITWSEGAYRATLTVPQFIPFDANLYAIGIITLWGETPFETRYAYLSNIAALLMDLPPTITIINPVNGSSYKGEVIASGTATDDHSVRAILVRIDNGEWQKAKGTTSWRIPIRFTTMEAKYHTIEVISFDGLSYSPISKVEFVMTNQARAENSNWSIVLLIMIITLVMMSIAMYLLSKANLPP